LRRRGVSAGRTLALAVSLAGVCDLAAGCGRGTAPSVASLATTSAASGVTAASAGASTAAQPSSAGLIECFASHGFQASIGSASSSGADNGVHLGGVTIVGNIDPGSPQFQAALQACRKYLPGGGPPSMTPEQAAKHAQALAAFAACMRKGGVSNFPDPTGDGQFPLGSLGQLDPTSPLFQTSYKACASLLPTFGPQLRFP
jgi:hypothetical protein